MARLGRSVVTMAMLAGVMISSTSITMRPPRSAIAATHTGPLLQPTVLAAQVEAGRRAGLFVRGPGLAQLTLSVRYPGGASSVYRGKTDGQGRYVFSWTVPADLKQSGTATLRLAEQRGNQHAGWSGTLAVRKAPLPPLFVQPLSTRYLAGTNIEIFVSTKPRANFSYRLTTAGGTLIAHGSARADARGRYVLSMLDRYLPARVVSVVAEITVSGPSGSTTGTAQVALLPRPALPLTVTVAKRTARAGRPFTVFVASKPKTTVSLTISLGSKVVARGNGTTDAAGHWRFSTVLNVPLRKATTARLQVQASSGIDHVSGQTVLLLQPGQLGVLDRLASPNNPAPNLSRFFAQIPDKVILVSAASDGQTLRAYEHGVLVHEDYVTTGRPELPTPNGVYQVMAKYTPYEMISPWPAGSPYYYPPSWTHFAMLFRDGGYFLHDAPWRAVYGPGTNLPHSSDPGEPIGTHGCINLPYSDMVWLWNWTPIGTTVVVY